MDIIYNGGIDMKIRRRGMWLNRCRVCGCSGMDCWGRCEKCGSDMRE